MMQVGIRAPRYEDLFPKSERLARKVVTVQLAEVGTPTATKKYAAFVAPNLIELRDAYLVSDNSMGTNGTNYVNFNLRNETDGSEIDNRDQNAAGTKETSAFVKLAFSGGNVAGTEVDDGDVLTLEIEDNGTAQDVGTLALVIEYVDLLSDVLNP